MPENALRRPALLALGAHLLAGLAMLFVLGRGLATNPDLSARMAFVSEHAWLWRGAWLTWTAASASILYCFKAMERAYAGPRWAVPATLLAVALDLSAQLLYAVLLPIVAGEPEAFLACDRLAVVMTGALANGFYTAAAAGLAWRGRARYPKWVSACAAGVLFAGSWLTLAAFLDSAAGMFGSNFLLVPSLVGWLAGVALSAPGGCPAPPRAGA